MYIVNFQGAKDLAGRPLNWLMAGTHIHCAKLSGNSVFFSLALLEDAAKKDGITTSKEITDA